MKIGFNFLHGVEDTRLGCNEMLFKRNKSSFVINYSDTFDPKFIKLIDTGIKKIGTIKSIIGNYGNNKTLYPIKDKYFPIQNWISHPISMFLKICGNITKFKILDYKLKKLNGFYFEKIQVQLFKNKKDLFFSFSNFPNYKNRNIKIVGTKGFIKFNSYNLADNYIFSKKKRFIKSPGTSIENVLNFFLNNIDNKKTFSNLDIGVKEHYLSNAILRKIPK